MRRFKKLRLIEFLIIGILFGVIEDLLAVMLVTGESVDLRILGIVFSVAIPFAFISEIIVDHPRFWEIILSPKDKRHRK